MKAMCNVTKNQNRKLYILYNTDERSVKCGLIDLDIRKLRLPNGRTIEQQMKYEAKRFMKILQEEIDIWYRSYSPSIYQRTYAMRDSIYAEDYVEIDSSGTQLTVKIKYTDEAMHDSLWGDGKINTLLLMNNGYQVQSGWHKNIENFGYREGGHFLERAVERFNRDNSFGIEINIDY